MKSKIYHVMGVLLLGLALTACRHDSDVLTSYNNQDALAFNEGEQSFAGKFRIAWNGLNQYYPVWDYEARLGVDWDAVYDEYLPQFEALDARDVNEDRVTNEELKALMKGFLGKLHDGHFYMEMKNHHTGRYVRYSPSDDLVASRDDYEVARKTMPSLRHYKYPSNGKVMTDASGKAVVAEYSTRWVDLLFNIKTDEGVGVNWLAAQLEAHAKKTLPTEHEVFIFKGMNTLYSELEKLDYTTTSNIAVYNTLVAQYAYLNVPGLDYIDPQFADDGIAIKSAILKGNTGGIAYLYFSDFSLTPYFSATHSQFDQSVPATANHIAQVKAVWQLWFDNIQTMHKNGTLEGIIIDIRGNGGGFVADHQYVMGALLPSGGFQYGWARFKQGTGRYDYSPLMPTIAPTMSDDHEVINDKPIVVLTNSSSVSMAEATALVAQCLPNGKVIGKRTHGGLNQLSPNEYASYNYTGHIGTEEKTPVYAYVPMMAVFDINKNLREGVGVTPDIEVALDVTTLESTDVDSQLERALEYIKNGK